MTAVNMDRHISMRRRKRARQLLHGAVVILVTLLFVCPLYVSLVYSLKQPSDMGTSSPLSLPSSLYLGNYRDVITKNSDFRTGFINSLITTAWIVGILTVITPMAAYVLARNRSRGYNFIYYIFLMGILIPF